MKKITFGICVLFALSYTPFVFAKIHHKTTVTKHSQESHIKDENSGVNTVNPQLVFYSSHRDKNNYVIALYTDRSGKALISYDSPTCQANSYGDTIINIKNKSVIEFTSTEDPLCKITFQTVNKNQLKITKETPACTAWHGDFCNFSSLSPLTRIYPQ